MIDIFEIKNFLEKDLILIFPTDTIFALVCNAHSKKAIDNLFDLKKREREKSFAIFCPKSKIHHYAHIDFEWQKQIIEKFFPGDVTFVLKAKDQKLINFGVTKNKKIGIRIPNSLFWNDLLDFLNFPLVATSVNFSGEKPALKFSDINSEILENPNISPKNYFLNQEDIIFSSNLPSSVFDISFDDPMQIKCLRKGRILLSQLFSTKI